MTEPLYRVNLEEERKKLAGRVMCTCVEPKPGTINNDRCLFQCRQCDGWLTFFKASVIQHKDHSWTVSKAGTWQI